MPDFEIVFEKLAETIRETPDHQMTIDVTLTPTELDEIEELRRFSAEIRDLEPTSFTTTK